VGVGLAGYWFGNIPWVKLHLEKIIWGLILVPGCIALFGAWRAGRAQSRSAAG
jgi:membrane-associated protein